MPRPPYEDDPAIPTLTQRADAPAQPSASRGTPGDAAWSQALSETIRDQGHAPPAPAGRASHGTAPAAAPAAAPAGQVSDTVLQALLQAEIERAVARALDDAVDTVRIRLEQEIPAIVERALRRARAG